MEITTNSTIYPPAAVELQRQARGRALEHGHELAAGWAQHGHNLESACLSCGFKAGVVVNKSVTYGLALTKTCPGSKEAARGGRHSVAAALLPPRATGLPTLPGGQPRTIADLRRGDQGTFVGGHVFFVERAASEVSAEGEKCIVKVVTGPHINQLADLFHHDVDWKAGINMHYRSLYGKK